MSVVVHVVLHLQLPNDSGDVGAVRAPVAHNPNRPVRTALLGFDADHPAAMHVRDLSAQFWNRLDAINHELLQFFRGAGWFGHFSIISTQGGLRYGQ